MRIVVLVSQAPLPGTILPLTVPSDGICWEKVPRGMSPGDPHAVEAAVRLRDATGARVIAITLGPLQAEVALRQALEQGADQAVHICDDHLRGCDAQATARALAAAIPRLRPSLVLCGLRSGTGGSGQVGTILAEHLGWPFVGDVVRMDLAGDRAIVDRLLEHGHRQRLRCHLPAVLAIAPQLAQPRYPPLRWRQHAARAELRRWDLNDLGLSLAQARQAGSCATLLSLTPPRSRPKKIFTPDSHLSAAERMRLVMSGGLTQKQGAMTKADPQAAARAIIEVLSQEKLI